MRRTILFLFILLVSSYTVVNAQIIRGDSGNEIFIHIDWYFDGYLHYALFLSEDYGESLQLNYEYGTFPGSQLILGEIFDDAQPGVLYNQPYYSSEFMISYDYGVSWELVAVSPSNGSFFAGKIPGEVFHYGFSTEGFLQKSNDFGQSFDTINSYVKFSFSAGVDSNTIYGINRTYVGYNQYFIHYSYDNGSTFSEGLMIDTAYTGYALEDLYRGAEEGEVYLVSRWQPDHYKVFFSSDDGQTWHLRHKTMQIDFWSFNFTPGSESGVFYKSRAKLDPTATFTLLYVEYSVDTAKTFTTFYHELTPEVGILERGSEKLAGPLICNPNPAGGFLRIGNLESYTDRNRRTILQVYSISGVKLEEIHISHQNEVKVNTSLYSPGVYFAVLRSDNQLLSSGKFLVQH